MKILHIVPSISPAMGGPTEVVINLISALRKLGVDSEIATTNDDGAGVLDVALGERTLYRGVPCWFFPRSRLRKRQYIFSGALTSWLWKNIPRYDMVDIHYLFTYSSTCAAWICRRRGVPYTLRTIGQLAPWSLRQSSFRKRVYSQIIERKNLGGASAIHCTSAGEAEDVAHYGVKTPLVIIPLGVQKANPPADSRKALRARCGIAENVPLVLFLSRIHPKKRVELLLEALRRIRSSGSNAELVIAGDGAPEYEASLKQLAERLGVRAQTHFLGFVGGAEKDLVLGGADVFALPSHSENFGIAVAEALAAALPVVITPEIQIAPDVDAYRAGLVVLGTAEDFARALLELLGDANRRTEIGKNGLKLVDAVYSWDLSAKQCAAVYRKVIDGSARRQTSSKEQIRTL